MKWPNGNETKYILDNDRKFCIDCKHHVLETATILGLIISKTHLCARFPEVSEHKEQDIVTGETKVKIVKREHRTCDEERRYGGPFEERYEGRLCGPKAKYFEKK